MPSASGGEKPRGSDKRGPGCHRPQPISSSKAFWFFFFFQRSCLKHTQRFFTSVGAGRRGTWHDASGRTCCLSESMSARRGLGHRGGPGCLLQPPPHHARSHLSPPRRPRGAPKGCSPSVETFFCPLFGSVFSLLSEGKGGSGRRRRRERR